MNASIRRTPCAVAASIARCGLGRGHGERLLAQDVLAGGGRLDRPFHVEVVGERDIDRVDAGSASSASYDPWAVGMPSSAATWRARASSREAMATTSHRSPRWMPGMTFFRPMSAVERMPQRRERLGSLIPTRSR